MTVWTKAITATLTITTAMNVYRMSVKARGGSVTITGSASLTIAGVPTPSGPVVLEDGQSDVFSAFPNAPIDGLIINPGGNTADVEIFFN